MTAEEGTAAEAEAEVLRRVGAGEPLGTDPVLVEAAARLAEAGLLSADSVGRWAAGPRGSLLDARRIEEARAGCVYGRHVEVHASVASTNDIVLERAAAGAEPGLVVCAELQTQGRGRRGRAFDSRPGLGIWSTTLLAGPADAARAPRLSLVAGLAVADAVAETTGADPGLKWPNDVLLGGRKVCGILVEARTVAGRLFPVAGIGVNVHHGPGDFPEELRSRAGSLAGVSGKRIDRTEYLVRQLDHLERWLAREEAGGVDLAAEYGARDALAGREVRVLTSDGAETGVARGVAEDGTLRVEVDGRVRTVRSGEATLADASGDSGGAPC